MSGDSASLPITMDTWCCFGLAVDQAKAVSQADKIWCTVGIGLPSATPPLPQLQRVLCLICNLSPFPISNPPTPTPRFIRMFVSTAFLLKYEVFFSSMP